MSVIKFKTKNDTEYTLEYNRKSIVEMEKLGFSFNDVSEKLMTSTTILMYGALYKNHKVDLDVADEILGELLVEYELEDILTNLTEMITEVFQPGGKAKKKKLVRQ